MKYRPHPEPKEERITATNRLTIVQDNRAASELFAAIQRSVEAARERLRKEKEANGVTGN